MQAEADAECEEGEAPAIPKEDDTVRLKPNRNLYQLRTALSHLYKSYKVPSEAGGPWGVSPCRNSLCSTTRLQSPEGDEGTASPAYHPDAPLTVCLQIVHFQGRMEKAIHLNPVETAFYNERMRGWMGAFCCVEEKPGHIL